MTDDKLDRRGTIIRGGGDFVESLAGLHRARSDRNLVQRVQSLADLWLGALRAHLVSRDPDRDQISAMLEERSPVREARIFERDALRNGFVSDVQRNTFPLLGVIPDPDTRYAALFPACGPDSRTGVLIEWAERPGDPAVFERASHLALVAGLVLQGRETERRYRLLKAEMENRIQNTIAIIRSVATRSAQSAESLEEHSLHFEGRLDALARYSVAFSGSEQRAELEPLVLDELLANGIEIGPELKVKGMRVEIDRRTAEPFCLAIHELAVNALKYGPFSGRGGSLTLRWWPESTDAALMLRFEWTEQCFIALSAEPTNFGFGRAFVEHGLPFEVGGTTVYDLTRRGLTCRMAIPLVEDGE